MQLLRLLRNCGPRGKLLWAPPPTHIPTTAPEGHLRASDNDPLLDSMVELEAGELHILQGKRAITECNQLSNNQQILYQQSDTSLMYTPAR